MLSDTESPLILSICLTSACLHSSQSRALLRRYWDERGFTTILIARVLNLLALGFTVVFSGFLLIWVDWGALTSDCVKADSCDISEVDTAPASPIDAQLRDRRSADRTVRKAAATRMTGAAEPPTSLCVDIPYPAISMRCWLLAHASTSYVARQNQAESSTGG